MSQENHSDVTKTLTPRSNTGMINENEIFLKCLRRKSRHFPHREMHFIMHSLGMFRKMFTWHNRTQDPVLQDVSHPVDTSSYLACRDVSRVPRSCCSTVFPSIVCRLVRKPWLRSCWKQCLSQLSLRVLSPRCVCGSTLEDTSRIIRFVWVCIRASANFHHILSLSLTSLEHHILKHQQPKTAHKTGTVPSNISPPLPSSWRTTPRQQEEESVQSICLKTLIWLKMPPCPVSRVCVRRVVVPHSRILQCRDCGYSVCRDCASSAVGSGRTSNEGHEMFSCGSRCV